MIAIPEMPASLGCRDNGMGRSVEPRYAPFEVDIDDAVRSCEAINAGDYFAVLRKVTDDDDLRALAPVGAVDQLTHSDDVMVTYTDWPARFTREYRAAMGRPRWFADSQHWVEARALVAQLAEAGGYTRPSTGSSPAGNPAHRDPS